MKKILKVLTFVMLCTALLAAAACTKEPEPEAKFSITGAKDLVFIQGEVTDEKLTEGVKVVFEDGTEKAVVLEKNEGDDFSKSGNYEIVYKYGSKSVKVRVAVYGAITFEYNGQTVTDTIEIGFKTAADSSNFTANVIAKDSFGKTLTCSVKEGSDKFANKSGEYSVTYVAKDDANQTAEKTVTYNVTNSKNITAANGTIDLGAKETTVTIGLDGMSDAYLLCGDDIVTPSYYDFDETSLTINGKFFYDKTVGDVTFTLCTEEGSVDFKIQLTDSGNPVFNLNEAKKNLTFKKGDNVYVALPEKEIPQHNYEYSYVLTSGNETYKAVETDAGVKLTDAKDGALPSGSYVLSVTATNNGKTATKTLSIRIYDEAIETPMEFTVATAASGITYEKTELDGASVMLYDLNFGDGVNIDFTRLQWKLSEEDLSTYKMLSFGFMYSSASCAADGKVNTKLLSQRYFSGATPISIYYTDINGNAVDADCLKIGEWYTANIAFNQIPDAGDMLVYPTYGRNESVEMYIKDVYLLKEVKNKLGIVFSTEGNDAGKFIEKEEDGKNIYSYVSNGTSAWAGRIWINNPDAAYKKLVIKYKLVSCNGTSEDGLDRAFDCYLNWNPITSSIKYFDENGNSVANNQLEIGGIYTAVIGGVSATGDIMIYPGYGRNVELTLDVYEAYFEKGTTYGEGQLGVSFFVEGYMYGGGTNAGKFSEKLSDGKIVQNYVTDGTSPWAGRIIFNYSSTDYKKLVVKFKAVSGDDSIVDGEANNAWMFEGSPSGIKYYNEAGEVIARTDLKTGTVYTMEVDLSAQTSGYKTLYPTYGRNVATTIDIYEAYLDTTPVA